MKMDGAVLRPFSVRWYCAKSARYIGLFSTLGLLGACSGEATEAPVADAASEVEAQPRDAGVDQSAEAEDARRSENDGGSDRADQWAPEEASADARTNADGDWVFVEANAVLDARGDGEEDGAPTDATTDQADTSIDQVADSPDAGMADRLGEAGSSVTPLEGDTNPSPDRSCVDSADIVRVIEAFDHVVRDDDPTFTREDLMLRDVNHDLVINIQDYLFVLSHYCTCAPGSVDPDTFDAGSCHPIFDAGFDAPPF